MPVSSIDNPYSDDLADPPDEAWWSTLLKNEEEAPAQIPVDEEGHTSIFATRNIPEIDWDLIQTIYESDSIVTLEVRSHNRGGLLVGTGAVQGFVPISHLIDLPALKNDQQRKKRLPSYVGRKLALKIIECDVEETRVIFSERAALAGEGSRRALFSSIRPGQVISGKVTNITRFGVFMDIGGVEGLIHISELSWGRVQHPGDLFEIGQTLDAQVLKISQADGRVALSHKLLFDNPWNMIAYQRQIGDIVEVEITSIKPYGIFVYLEEGIEGLIHISTIALPDGIDHLEEYFTVGAQIKAEIIQIDPGQHRLGMKMVD